MFLYLDCFIAHDIHNTVGVNLCDHFWTEINWLQYLIDNNKQMNLIHMVW
jgi:hypothetical protein